MTADGRPSVALISGSEVPRVVPSTSFRPSRIARASGTRVVTERHVDVSTARALAARAFGEEAGTVVYVDRVPRDAGIVTVGTEHVRIDRPALVVFRDEAPGANWMHACSYALVDLGTGDVVMTTGADRPPRFGLLPDTWVVATDPDGRADLVPPDQPRQEET